MQPALPAAGRRRWDAPLAFRKDQVLEPRYPPPQGTHAALSDQAMVRVEDGPQKVDALAAALEYHLVGVEYQSQPFLQEGGDALLMRDERCRVVRQQHEIIHVAQVATHLERVFDELVQFVEIDVGKKLTGQAADGEPHLRRRMVERFVRRDARQQRPVAAEGGWRVDGRLHEDGGGYLVELSERGGIHGNPGQGVAPELEHRRTMNAGKEGLYIKLAVPAVPGLSHEMLQSVNSGLRALAFSVGVAVVDEAFVPPGFDVPHQPLMHQPVGECWGKYLTQFGVGNGEDRE